jgi:hypothetical protein
LPSFSLRFYWTAVFHHTLLDGMWPSPHAVPATKN